MSDRRIISHAILASERLLEKSPGDDVLLRANRLLTDKWKEWFETEWTRDGEHK